MHLLNFLVRYSDFREAVEYLKQNNTTVESRKNALNIINKFMDDIRVGVFDKLFIGEK